MASNVIEVLIKAKDETNAAIKSAEGGFSGFTKRLQSMGGAFSTAASAIGPVGVAVAGLGVVMGTGAAAAKGFFEDMREGANVADALNETANRTGLTVEQVSRLKYATEQSMASFEGLNVGLRFLAKNLYEAQTGGQEMQATLKAIGFEGAEASGFLGQSDEALLKIADRLAKIPDAGTRTALALKLMGRGAAELVPFLSQGGDAIRALMADSDRLGATVSSKAGELGDAFNDAFGRMNRAIDGFKTRLLEVGGEGVITAIDRVTEAIAKLTTNHKALAGLERIITFTIEIGVKGIEAFEWVGEQIGKFEAMADKGAKEAVEKYRKREATLTPQQRAFDLEQRMTNRELGFYYPQQPVPPAIGQRAAPPLIQQPKRPGGMGGAEDAEASAARKKALAEQQAFTDALRESWRISDSLGLSLQKTFGTVPATSMVEEFHKVLGDIAKDNPIELRAKIKWDEKFKPDTILNTEDIPEVPLKWDLSAPLAGINAMVEALERAGVSAEYMYGVLATSGETAFMLAAGFEAAFATLKARLDPTANFISDMTASAMNFAETFVGAMGEAFTNLFEHGARFLDTIGNFLVALGKAVQRFVLDIGMAIAKALVLKAIFGSIGGVRFVFFGSRGGEVPRMRDGGTASPGPTAPAARPSFLALGGVVPRIAEAVRPVGLAAGGAISHVFPAPRLAPIVVHAATGVRVIPGTPQAYDSVPAVLSPGEVVLPVVGGRSPADLLTGLDRLGRDLAVLLARASAPAPAQTTAGMTVNVSTIDAAGFRSFVRRGELAREQVLANDPARD